MHLFGTFICLLIDCILIADEPIALNVPEIYGIILKNQNNLTLGIKRKVLQLIEKFASYQDEVMLDFHVSSFLQFIFNC